MASASLTFWQQTPTAPSSICFSAMTGHLCVLACGLRRTLLPFTRSASRRRLLSKASRSTMNARVSTSSRLMPISAGGRVVIAHLRLLGTAAGLPIGWGNATRPLRPSPRRSGPSIPRVGIDNIPRHDARELARRWPDRPRLKRSHREEKTMAEAMISGAEDALENQRIGGLRMRAAPLSRDDDHGDVHRRARWRLHLRPIGRRLAAQFRLAERLYRWRHRAALAGRRARIVAAGVAALPRDKGQSDAARDGIAAAARHPAGPIGGNDRCRQRQPDQDAVRRGLCAADGAALGHLFLQPDEFVPVRLLAAGGPASRRHDAGRGGSCLELSRSRRDFCRGLSRAADRPAWPRAR